MKESFKKYRTIIAIVVWIIAVLPFIKIFFTSGKKHSALAGMLETQQENMKETQQSFTLYNNYGDPFLGNEIRIKPVTSFERKTVSAEIKKSKPVPPPVTDAVKPAIVYTGIIKNKQSNKEVGIFTINGNNALLSINQQQEGVKLLKLFSDSALVEFNKEKWYCKK